MATLAAPAALAARVLVVEDEGLIARDIGSILDSLGYAVAGFAESGAEALEAVLSEQPDLVLMDIRIRGEWDGIETARKIQQRAAIPVVYLTAHADDATLKRASATGPFGYIVKPFNTPNIKAALEISLQRHRTQCKLERREADLSAAVAMFSDAVFICTHLGHVKTMNAAAEQLIGVKLPAALGRGLEELFNFHSKGLEVVAGDCSTRLPTKARELCSGVLKRLDGGERPVVRSASQVNGRDAEEADTVILFHDLSEAQNAQGVLRRSNEKLKRSNEALTQLSYSLVHDLGEPLHTMAIASELLAQISENDPDPERKEYLTWIRSGCRDMQSMISALLEYQHASASASVDAVPVSSQRILESTLTNLRAAIRESNAIVDFDKLPDVYTQPVALLQIFQNLIANAIKFRSEAAPRIEISARRRDAFWMFTVSDNGIGFDPSAGEQIFSLFNRTNGHQYAGHGVGLATCRKLVEQFGGQIWADSQIAQGSHFYFTLPATPPDH